MFSSLIVPVASEYSSTHVHPYHRTITLYVKLANLSHVWFYSSLHFFKCMRCFIPGLSCHFVRISWLRLCEISGPTECLWEPWEVNRMGFLEITSRWPNRWCWHAEVEKRILFYWCMYAIYSKSILLFDIKVYWSALDIRQKPNGRYTVEWENERTSLVKVYVKLACFSVFVFFCYPMTNKFKSLYLACITIED